MIYTNKTKQMISYYRLMNLIRLFEERVDKLVSEGLIAGTTHLCIGQEAVPVGVYAALRKDDYAIGTHRGHGHILAKGADVKKVMAELFGKKTGYCKGLGGTQHMAAFDINFLGTNGITGGGIPIATGVTLALKMKKSDSITVCFIGDGSVNQGTFHESLNMASIWKLPIIYIIENNLYAMSTRINKAVNIDKLSLRAVAYGIKGYTIDGNDVFEIKQCVEESAKIVRKGKGPILIEALTYRHKGHSKSDSKIYRTREEEKFWMAKDPIQRLEKKILKECKIDKKELKKIKSDIKNIIDKSIEFAQKSDSPSFEEVLT